MTYTACTYKIIVALSVTICKDILSVHLYIAKSAVRLDAVAIPYPLFDTTSGSLCCLPPNEIYLALFVKSVRSVASIPLDLSFSDLSQSKMCSTRHYLKALALWHFHLQGDFCRHQNTVWLRFSFLSLVSASPFEFQ